MLAAMAIAAVLCVCIGTFPAWFYSLLPFRADFHPYSLDHVMGQLQLLFLSALAFTLLMRTGIYPPELRSTNLDFDWFYRRLGPAVALAVARQAELSWRLAVAAGAAGIGKMWSFAERHHGPEGILARTGTTGTMALWAAIMLAAYLLLSYL
jgi:multicomponent Na+:H+ antiporter subunit D